MKKFALALLIGFFALSVNHLFAAPVSPNLAKWVAHNFYNERSNGPEVNFHDPVSITESGITLYYILEAIGNNGYVIVSADDAAYPILGYSFQGNYEYDNEKQAPAFKDLMKYYGEQIKYIIDYNLTADSATQVIWFQYSSPAGPQISSSVAAISPLLGSISWGQGCYYNADCPADVAAGSSYCNHVPVGCVAVAMAQVMKYWAYPASGTGSNSYVHSTYGTQSANFSTATYNWASMPNSATAANTHLAQIMYHCGVSVDMNYGPTGSGASTAQARNSLVNNFNYNSAAQYYTKSSYTTSAWELMLKNELDASRPVIYRGNDATGSGGHAFVCDGYQGTSNNHFHFNWGWSGYLDGYFFLTSLNPGTSGMNFSYDQAAIMGIQPLTPSSPIADFSASSTTVIVGNSIDFTDQTSGLPTSWSWTFNGASPSTSSAQNPTNITYNTVGTYAVKLVVSNANGTDSITKTNYITVSPYCAAYAATCDEYISNVVVGTISNASACSNYADYTNISTNMTIGSTYPITITNPIHYTGDAFGCWIDWNQDNDFSDPGESITISYNNGTGTGSITPPATAVTGNTRMRIRIVYNETLTPCDTSTYGEVEDYTINVTGVSTAPTADFTVSQTTAGAGQIIQFTDLSVGVPSSWSWNFGDGNTSAVQNPTHNYATPGVYTVSLQATNLYGSTTETKTNYITITSSSGCDTITNLLATDTMTYYSITGNWGYLAGHNQYQMTAYADKFTNGSPIQLTGVELTSAESHAGSSTSSYITVKVYSEDANGKPGTDIYSKQVLISNLNPFSINYIAFDSAINITTNYFVGFELNYTAPQDTFVCQMAQFRPNGNSAYIQYLGSWDDLPTLFANSAYNSSLAMNVVKCPVVVSAPVASFTANPTSITAGSLVSFTDQSSGNPASWYWNFGDGYSSSVQNPTHTYNTAGQYDVSLVITNVSGSDTLIKSNYIVVNSPPPTAAFNINPAVGYPGDTIWFTDQSAGNPTSWKWSFGDNSSSSIQNPYHIYQHVGFYDIKLVVQNAQGQDSMEISSGVYIQALPPMPLAAFAANQTSIIEGQSVNFTDYSGGNPSSWKWTFDGGSPSTSTQQNPQNITYNSPGSYDVKLIVSNASGNDTMVKTGYIKVSGIGIEENDITKIKVYPNPASDFIVISNIDNISLKQIGVFDISGRMVDQIEGNDLKSAEIKIDVSALSEGVYILKITGENTKSAIKINVMH